jgi:hypothetical protein
MAVNMQRLKKVISSLMGFYIGWCVASYFLQPPIVLFLPANLKEAEKIFEERVKARFAVGMSEIDLKKTLKEQGFSIITGKNMAHYSNADLVCSHNWTITWEASENKQIIDIHSYSGAVCL